MVILKSYTALRMVKMSLVAWYVREQKEVTYDLTSTCAGHKLRYVISGYIGEVCIYWYMWPVISIRLHIRNGGAFTQFPVSE